MNDSAKSMEYAEKIMKRWKPTRITMTHLIEGYLNTVDEGVDPEANDRAIAGMKLLLDALPRVIRNGEDGEARKMMSMASTLIEGAYNGTIDEILRL